MESAPVPNVAFAGTACFQCFKASPNLQKCSSCRIVKYCSQDCSVKDWKDHKSFCRSLKAIRSTITPPTPFDPTSTSNQGEISKRRVIQRKTWLTEDELLETALKRQATMLESKLLWREPRCQVCWDREYDVEKRKLQDEKSWRICKACRVVGFCGKEHAELARKAHYEAKDVEGRSQCESIQLSNEIAEFFLRQHLASSVSSTNPSSPSLWVPNRSLSTRQPLPSSWSDYLSSVSSFLPSPTPPLAEIYGIFLESLSPVLTILSALQRLDLNLSTPKMTLYLLDESLETCSNWIPCLEELQHQLPSLQHLELITVSPLPSATTTAVSAAETGSQKKTTQLSSVTKLPMCPQCTSGGRSRTITHLSELPTRLEKGSVAVSFNSSIALSTDLASNPTTFWARTLKTLLSTQEKERIPLLLTSQTKEEAKDVMQALKGVGEVEQVWKVEKNVWKGGWGRVEGWWGIEDDEEDGEGIVWKNGWWSATVRSSASARHGQEWARTLPFSTLSNSIQLPFHSSSSPSISRSDGARTSASIVTSPNIASRITLTPHREQQKMSMQAFRSEPTGWNPLKGVEWTVETEVETMKQLVRDREEVFEKHRQINEPILREESSNKLQTLIKEGTVVLSCFARYVDFCTTVNIPAFPISFSSISLFLLAKHSFSSGNFGSVYLNLCRSKAAIHEIWEGVVDYDDLEDGSEIEEGLKEFMSKMKAHARATDLSEDSGSEAEVSSDSDSDSDDFVEYAPRTKRSFIPDLARSKEGEGERSDESSEEASDGEIEQLTVSGLPQPGDRFPTSNDLLVACSLSNIPVFGNGVFLREAKNGTIVVKCMRSKSRASLGKAGTCSWKIGATADAVTGGFVVRQDSSYLHHNHGRSPELERNPSYLPTIFNPVIRKAFGLPKLATSSNKRRRSSSSSSVEPSRKKSRLSPVSAQSNLSSPPIQVRPHDSQDLSSAGYPASAASELSLTRPFTNSSAAAMSPSTDFYPQLNSFLKALHPSLASLTPHLIAAGIDCSDSLILLCSLESEILEKSLKAIQTKARARNEPLSIVHLKLLKKLIGEAQAGNYSA